MSNKHNDCVNFESFDVAKGYCVKTDKLVPFAGESCAAFQQTAKCKNCNKFASPDAAGIGTCTGLEDRSYWQLGERSALNCEGYAKA